MVSGDVELAYRCHNLLVELRALIDTVRKVRDVSVARANAAGRSYRELAADLGVSKPYVQQMVAVGRMASDT